MTTLKGLTREWRAAAGRLSGTQRHVLLRAAAELEQQIRCTRPGPDTARAVAASWFGRGQRIMIAEGDFFTAAGWYVLAGRVIALYPEIGVDEFRCVAVHTLTTGEVSGWCRASVSGQIVGELKTILAGRGAPTPLPSLPHLHVLARSNADTSIGMVRLERSGPFVMLVVMARPDSPAFPKLWDDILASTETPDTCPRPALDILVTTQFDDTTAALEPVRHSLENLTACWAFAWQELFPTGA